MIEIALCPGIKHTMGSELYNFLSFLAIATRLQSSLDGTEGRRVSVVAQVPRFYSLDAGAFFTNASVRAWERASGVRWEASEHSECDPFFARAPYPYPNRVLRSQHDMCVGNQLLSRSHWRDGRPVQLHAGCRGTFSSAVGTKGRPNPDPIGATLAWRLAMLACVRMAADTLLDEGGRGAPGARPLETALDEGVSRAQPRVLSSSAGGRLRVYLPMQERSGTAWLHAAIQFGTEARLALRLLEIDERRLLRPTTPSPALGAQRGCAYVFLRSPTNGTHVYFSDEGCGACLAPAAHHHCPPQPPASPPPGLVWQVSLPQLIARQGQRGWSRAGRRLPGRGR